MIKKQINNNRPNRVAAKVQTIVAEILRDRYPQINITLTDSVAGGNAQFIKLYYQGDASAQKKLDEITQTIRYELAAQMQSKYVPDIRFEYDDTLERATRIDELLKNIDK